MTTRELINRKVLYMKKLLESAKSSHGHRTISMEIKIMLEISTFREGHNVNVMRKGKHGKQTIVKVDYNL